MQNLSELKKVLFDIFNSKVRKKDLYYNALFLDCEYLSDAFKYEIWIKKLLR